MARKSEADTPVQTKSVTIRVPIVLFREIKAEADDRAEYITDVMLRRLAGRRATVRDGYGKAYALYTALRELNILRLDENLQNDPARADQVNQMFDEIHERFFAGVENDGRK